MTATLPDGMEYKNLGAACIDAVADTVWGSEYPEEDGVRNHIVAVTGVRDEVGDIIVPGAFTHTLERLEPKACMGHDWNRPVGYPEAIKELMPGDPRLPKTDRFGRPWPAEAGALFARTRYNLDTEDGQRAYKDARFLGARLACSIGYVDPKDENGKPLYSYKKIDPASGLMTRFLPRLDLFEYSQVLHGAHLLAGGLKDGKPTRLERKERPSTELKVRLVRDQAYWGLPLGTPIRPGMKPQGPKARRLVAAGRQADDTAGAVEVDANNLQIKPTAKGKLKGSLAIDTAYSDTMTLLNDLGDHNPYLAERPDGSTVDVDPFDDTSFVVEDHNSINKGELYNPLDILVANAITPAELEENLRNADWDADRLGDAADRQDEIDSFVADVVDAYREKYNAELVRQNDSGDNEVADPPDGSAESQPDTTPAPSPTDGSATQATAGQDRSIPPPAGEPVQVREEPAGGRFGPGYAIPPPPADTAEPQAAQADMAAAGQPAQDPNRPVAPAAAPEESAPQASAGLPEMAVHNGDPVNIRAVDGDTANVYNTRTEQGYDVPVSELLTGGASADKPATVKLNDIQREAADLAFGNGEPIDVSGAELTGDGLNVVNIAEALATIDTRFEVFEDNPDQKRRHGRALKAVRAKIAKMAKPGETTPPGDAGTSDESAADPAVGKFPDGTKPSPKLIAALGNATWVSGQRFTPRGHDGERGQSTADGWLVRGNNTTVFKLFDKGVAESPDGVQPQKGARGAYLLTDEGARLLAPYLPNGGKRDGGQPANEAAPESLPGNGNAPAAPSSEIAPERSSGQSDVDGAASGTSEPDLTGLATDQLIERLYHGPDSAAAQREYDRRFSVTPEQQARFDALTPEQQAVYDAALERNATQDEALAAAEGNAAPPPGDTAGEPLGETDPALADPSVAAPADAGTGDEPLVDDATPDAAETEEITPEEITPEEIADTEESADASFGVTEAPDGEFETDPDIADRQDRVASLLTQSEAGSLDLSRNKVGDDQLRATRADIVDELRLQQHLERRGTGERAISRQQAETQAADGTASPEQVDQPVDSGPKPRPGVAGAAEDLADALDNGDDDQIDAAVQRFRSALARSRSDSPVVEELRAMLAPENGGWDAGALRDAAERLREEQRAKRNDSARRRRTARRFERERLRSLLGQVEAEMRSRELDFDPIPDDDGTVTLDLGASAPVAWSTEARGPDWANTSTRVDTLAGSGYAATVSTYVKPDGTAKPSEYRWSVTGDDGVVLASGSGTANDPDSARAIVEIALDTQRRLGLIPVDAQIPQGSVPQHTSATPLGDVVDAISVMRTRLTDGRQLNPVTGQPDPFADTLAPLPVPERSRFADADAVLKHLEVNGPPSRTGNAAVVNLYRWDSAKMTPGGAFVVVDDLKGKPQIVHTVSGGSFPPPLVADNLGRADLLRYAEIIESLPDSNGQAVDWSLRNRELMDDMQKRDYAEGNGVRALQEATINRLAREKIRSGQFTHKLVLRDTAFIGGVTNPSREQFARDQHRALTQLINATRGKPSTFDKKTIDAARGARTLAAMGAPDVAAVLLNRRAAEVREQYGADAPSHGSAVLDALATGYLGMFSPMRSPGERVQALKPGEQVFLAEKSEDGKLRSFRALAAPRRDPRGGPSETITPVIDESTGAQKILRVVGSEFRIEEDEEIRYGYNPLSADLGSGLFTVVGPGEEAPATAEDLRARQFSDAAVIPQDVLDAAAEVLPETRAETAARRATPSDGVRPPRLRSPAAPKRTAPPAPEPEPVRGEQHLAQAQGRSQGKFLGMPFEYGEQPERGSFGSMDEVREHLVAVQDTSSSARATIKMIDAGDMKLSPGGVFLVGKDGWITHANSGNIVWPPRAGSDIGAELHTGGNINQSAGLRVARALESGVFDGEQIDWSGDGRTAVKQTGEISKRSGNFHPLRTAQRVAYQDGVLGTAKPGKNDVVMIGSMVKDTRFDAPNAEAFDESALREKMIDYEGLSGYAADSKAGETLAKRVANELRIARPLARTAPLDMVRRLTRLADELDGKTVGMRPTRDNFLREKAGPKTLTPSDDLRAAAAMITDVYDPDKISESGRFRQAGMVGQVELTKPRITVGRTWEDPNGVAGREVERQIKDAGGIRFYRDENGLLHATWAGVDITEGQLPVNGSSVGAIKLFEDGGLTLSYVSANRLIVVEASPRSWKFTPEETGNEDTGGDISGPETESVQIKDGAETDTPQDIGAADTPADEDKE